MENNKITCLHDILLKTENRLVDYCEKCGVIIYYPNILNLNSKEQNSPVIKILSIKQKAYSYNVSECPLKIFEKMQNYNYDKFENIDLESLSSYQSRRNEVKALLWQVINKLKYKAQTFYQALFFIDSLFAMKKLEHSGLRCLELISISCLILACNNFNLSIR